MLVATRAPSPTARKAAVAVLSQLAKRLATDYLPLLPEALPFLAELLEDVEPDVRASASQLVRVARCQCLHMYGSSKRQSGPYQSGGTSKLSRGC